jgi:hypothetical protein
MENTYLYYPARKVHKILSSPDIVKKGFRVVFSDTEDLSLIIRKDMFLFRKKFFEVRIEPTKEEKVSCISVAQIYTEKPDVTAEKEVIQVILKIF